MLALTRKTDYALIALTHLARTDASVSSAREISERYKVSLPLLMNILKQLNKAGFVTSVRGARGGYRLAVDADELSLRQLITTVEGPLRLVRCATAGEDPDSGCVRMSWCPVRSTALRLHRKLEQFLEDITLAEIIANGNQTAAWPNEREKDECHAPSLPG